MIVQNFYQQIGRLTLMTLEQNLVSTDAVFTLSLKITVTKYIVNKSQILLELII